MNTIKQTLSAGQTFDVQCLGMSQETMFQLLECSSAVTLEFIGNAGKPLSTSEGVLSGLKVRNRLQRVRITNGASAQTIKVGVSDGVSEYDRVSGEVVSDAKIPTARENSAAIDIPATGEVVVAASDSDRVEHHVYFTVDVMCGASGVLPTTDVSGGVGTYYPANTLAVIDGTAAVYACSADGVSSGTAYGSSLKK